MPKLGSPSWNGNDFRRKRLTIAMYVEQNKDKIVIFYQTKMTKKWFFLPKNDFFTKKMTKKRQIFEKKILVLKNLKKMCFRTPFVNAKKIQKS